MLELNGILFFICNEIEDVEICYFCGQVFDEAIEKSEHILQTHLEHRFCFECNNDLICIGGKWYQLHVEINCNTIKLEPDYDAQCTEIETCAVNQSPFVEQSLKHEPIEINESQANIADVTCIESDPLQDANDSKAEKSASDELDHEVCEPPTKPFPCAMCPMSFKHQQNRSIHMRLAHMSRQRIGIKPVVFRSSTGVRRPKSLRFACEVCLDVFAYRQNRDKHMRNLHGRHAPGDNGQAPYKRRESDVKMWACGLCSKKSAFKPNMYRHLRCRHGVEDKTMAIPILDPSPDHDKSEPEPLSAEARVSGPSDRADSKIDTLAESTDAVSLASTPKKLRERDVRMWECGVCAKMCAFRPNMYRHIRTQHGVDDLSLAKPILYWPTTGPRHVRSRKSDAKMGTLAESTDAMSPTFRPQPSKKLRNQDVRMWECGVCSKMCVFRPNMYRHIRTQHGVEDFSLAKPILFWPSAGPPGTGKRRSHEKVWACGMCTKKSAFRSNMYVHLRTWHGVNDKSMIKPLVKQSGEYREADSEPSKGATSHPERASRTNDKDSASFKGAADTFERRAPVPIEPISPTKLTQTSRPPQAQGASVKMWACGLCSKKSAFKSNMHRHLRTWHGTQDMSMAKPILDRAEDDDDDESENEQDHSMSLQQNMTAGRRANDDHLVNFDDDSDEPRDGYSTLAHLKRPIRPRRTTQAGRRPSKVRCRDVKMWECSVCLKKCAHVSNIYRHLRKWHSIEDKSMARPLLDWDENDGAHSDSSEANATFTGPGDPSTNDDCVSSTNGFEVNDAEASTSVGSNHASSSTSSRQLFDRQRVHEDVWMCGLCPKKSAFRHNLYRHIRTRHGIEDKSMVKPINKW